jgi:hypothetical protein
MQNRGNRHSTGTPVKQHNRQSYKDVDAHHHRHQTGSLLVSKAAQHIDLCKLLLDSQDVHGIKPRGVAELFLNLPESTLLRLQFNPVLSFQVSTGVSIVMRRKRKSFNLRHLWFYTSGYQTDARFPSPLQAMREHALYS